MKKLAYGIVIMAVVAIAFGSVGSVFAQSEPPSPASGPWSGEDRPANCGGMGDQDRGWLRDEMIAAYSKELGISAADLESRLENGETMADIAYAEGLSREEFFQVMKDVRNDAIDQAVKNGNITEEQASWMKNRGMRMLNRWDEFRENRREQGRP